MCKTQSKMFPCLKCLMTDSMWIDKLDCLSLSVVATIVIFTVDETLRVENP